jgi:hypothetical protein
MRSRRLGGTLAAALACASLLAAGSAPARADVVWLCKPGAAGNPCEIPQDTTIQEAGKPDRVETPRSGPRKVDCFYVYPTVSNQTTPNATKARDPELESIAKFQAARFDQQCRIFAPIYRQSTLASIATGYASASGADRQLAYSDVLEAWRAYIAEDNGGRGVVLLGHSQGTAMLRQLLRREIEKQPAQRRRIVGAILLGGNVTVAEGRAIGGDFASTPLCTRRAQVGCVVAFSTFAEDPPENSRFGRSASPPADNPSTLPGGPGFTVACTDPRPLAGTTEPLRLVTPSEPFAPGPINIGIAVTAGGTPPSAPTTWVSPADRADGGCRTINGAHVLRLDPLPGSRRPNPFPEPGWGTHLIDVNIALDPLVSLVAQQADRWVRPQLRLVRRCRDHRMRVRVIGRDAEFVRSVDFKIGRRLAARDGRPGFERRIGPRRLRAAKGARRLRAVVFLEQGAPQRLVLERNLPRC